VPVTPKKKIMVTVGREKENKETIEEKEGRTGAG